MQRKLLNYSAVALACASLACFAATSAETGTPEPPQPFVLDLKFDQSSGIYDANFTATDENGTLYAFSVGCIAADYIAVVDSVTGEEHWDYLYQPGGATLRGFTTNETAVTVPDSVRVNLSEWQGGHNMGYTTVAVERIDFHDNYYDENETYLSFVNCPNLKEIYTPYTITSVNIDGNYETTAPDIYFTAPTAPESWISDEARRNLTFYVPQHLYANYTAWVTNDYPIAIVWSNDAEQITINVEVPGTLGDDLAGVAGDLSSVRWLKVTGNPNEDDLRLFRRLPFLEILDLSECTGLKTMIGCNNLQYLHEVKLPEALEAIGNSAFYATKSLRKLELPASVKTIGENAFRNSNIAEINLGNVEIFEAYCLGGSKLKKAELYNAVKLNPGSFNSCYYITEVTFGPKLSHVGSDTFTGTQIESLILPGKVDCIESYGFHANGKLKHIELRGGVKDIHNYAFCESHPETVIWNELFPTNNKPFEGAHMENAVVYVPAVTLNEYFKSDAWANCPDIRALEEDRAELYIDHEFLIRKQNGIAEKASLTIGKEYNNDNYGHLSVNCTSPLNFGEVNLNGRFSNTWRYDELGNYTWFDNYNGATLITDSEVTAGNVALNFEVQKERWYFFTLPFDVNVKDVETDEDALWVVRRYSGEDRAKLTGKSWQNMTDETVLKAGQGYILHCTQDGRDRVNFTFRPAESGNGLFTAADIVTPLQQHESEFPHNASWNLVGNSYPAFLSLRGIGFDAPVTVYENGTYYAYSPVDDDYTFAPFQAFFVQRQDLFAEYGDTLRLSADARFHSRESAEAAQLEPKRAPRREGDRAVFNFTIGSDKGADRARLVINDGALDAYEANRDASKFMSLDAAMPQLYLLNANQKMAIDERPLGEGRFNLGFKQGGKGMLTISLDSRSAAGYSVILIDTANGTETDLTATAYTFDAKEGVDDNRFIIEIVRPVSGIDAAGTGAETEIAVNGNQLTVNSAVEVEVTVAAADGRIVARGTSDGFAATLPAGVYVVKAGNKTVKVMAGK